MEFTDEMLSCTVADDIMLNCYQNKQQKFHYTRFPSVFVEFKFIVVLEALRFECKVFGERLLSDLCSAILDIGANLFRKFFAFKYCLIESRLGFLSSC